MKYFLIPLVAVVLLTSCSSSKKTSASSSTTSSTSQTTSSSSSDADGSSFEKAIVIDAKSEGPGVTAEYAWLKKNYPGYTTQSQSLSYHEKKPFDIITIKTGDGAIKKVYFDISKFFGKM